MNVDAQPSIRPFIARTGSYNIKLPCHLVLAAAIHQMDEEFARLSSRNFHGRLSDRPPPTVQTKLSSVGKSRKFAYQFLFSFHALLSNTCSISAPPSNNSTVPLKPLFFEIPSTENEPAFVGRQWLYKEIEQAFDDDSGGRQGVVIAGGIGHGKTSALLQLVNRSCFGRRGGAENEAARGQASVRTLASQLVAYHFCQADNSVTCTVPEFVHNLAAQLFQAPQLGAYRTLLHATPSLQKLLSLEDCVTNPLRSLVKGILDPLINLKRLNKIPTDGCCIVVIDGISEAEFHRSDYGDTIASFLAKCLSRFPPWLKIIATVRTSFQDVTKLFPFHRISLDKMADNECLGKDIQDYIGLRMNASQAIRRNVTVNTGKVAEASPGRFTAHLTTLSKGSFLFVKLTLDMVEQGRLVMKGTSFKVLPVTLAELFLLQFNLRFPSVKSFEKVERRSRIWSCICIELNAKSGSYIFRCAAYLTSAWQRFSQ